MLSIMKWIMEGNRGLVYVRVMRTPSGGLYARIIKFEFGKGHVLRQNRRRTGRHRDQQRPRSSRGAGGGEQCAQRGIGVGVVDMPSIDEELPAATCTSRASCCSSPNRTMVTSGRIS